MMASRVHCRLECLIAGFSSRQSSRACIIGTKTNTDARSLARQTNRHPGPSSGFADHRDNTLPKRWYNLDVVLTDDFPRP